MSWERVEALFAGALEQPPEQRAAYLAAAVEDPESSGEVLALLAYEGRGRFDSIADRLRGMHLAAASVPLADLADRLRVTLVERYTIEREIGRGGMASVFLARDLKHDRPVAIKVVRPELAATLGSERFLREIQIAARLQHPNILALYDSGAADGALYYVMPYVEGESLRARLEREGQLPIDDALRIAREVADALAYAHSHDVVHRDIKPENILFAGDHCLVADFGIARAITAAGGDKVTEPGMAVGTPAYMSPEQAAAEQRIDGRSDIYSLGCVLYEMLLGHPPFSGMSAQEILARHTLDPVPPLRTVRQGVSEPVEQAVMKALAKAPADRFATVWEFGEVLRASASAPVHPPVAAPSRRWRRAAAVALVVVAVTSGVVVWRRIPDRGSVTLDPDVVAILPFRVAGADPSLKYLREGMMDLLATRFTGAGAPRAVDPRSVMAAIRRLGSDESTDPGEEDALRMARNLGAGQMLLGSVVSSGNRLVLNASLVVVSGAGTRAQAEIEGPSDSLPILVDRLAGQLLAKGSATAGKPAPLTTSLEALKNYIAGQRAYRHGVHDSAIGHFSLALAADSDFMAAAVGLALNTGSGTPVPNWPRVQRLLWRNRQKLSAPDRALIEGLIVDTSYFTWAQALAAIERAATIAGDRADTWYVLGDYYFHEGRLLGYDDWAQRAKRAFQRALAFDSSFAGPLDHLIALAAMEGDTATVHRGATLFRDLNQNANAALRVRWVAAVSLGDSAELHAARAAFGSVTGKSAWIFILYYATAFGPYWTDAALIIEARERSDATSTDRANTAHAKTVLALNRGRPAEAARQFTEAARQFRLAGTPRDWLAIHMALYADGDTAQADEAARRIGKIADQPLTGDTTAQYEQLADRCDVEQWRLARGRTASAREAIQMLRSAEAARLNDELVAYVHLCADLLEARVSVAERRPTARIAVERVDSILATGPSGPVNQWNLAVARLYAALGDPQRALTAVRRRNNRVTMLGVATYLRELGRYAALAGDREAAIAAYSQYLRMLDDPEPAMRSVVEDVREDLARLIAEGR